MKLAVLQVQCYVISAPAAAAVHFSNFVISAVTVRDLSNLESSLVCYKVLCVVLVVSKVGICD